MKSIRSVIRIFGYINYILTSKQKRASILVFISMILCSLLELLGVSIIYPFLMLMMNENGMRDKWYLGWVYKLWPDISNVHVIIMLGIIVAVVYVIKNALALLCSYVQAAYSARINRELSVKMLKSYMMRPYEFFVNTHSKYIIRGLSGDVNSVHNTILNGFQIFAELLTMIMIVAYLIKVDVFIALFSILAGGLSFLAITFGFKGIMKRLGRDSRGVSAEGQGFTYQIITGIKEITVLDRKECFIDKYDQIAQKNAKITKKTQVITAMPDRAMEAVCVIVIMTVLCLRIAQGVDMQTFLPTLGAFGMGVFRIMPSMSKLSGRINTIVYLQAGLENAYGIMKDAEIIERDYVKEEKELEKQVKEHGYDKLSFKDKIVLKNVYWKYEKGTENVLKGLDMTIRLGESVGIIGSSGGGKSTLVDIMMSLFKPQSGSVTMDGVDIFLMKYRWRSLIGYVPQAIFLSSGSIRENVAFGIPADKTSDARVWRALERAQLKEFVESLPGKLDTTVGEHGVNFSGGQRQRVAIARALYDEPEILIFDEATSALDNETEKAFMDSIESLQGEKTIILVAHRLTTVKNCDRVYEIKDGIAIERDIREIIKNI